MTLSPVGIVLSSAAIAIVFLYCRMSLFDFWRSKLFSEALAVSSAENDT
jgi:hypothetical protein